MLYTPVIPATGIVGWNFLQSTYDRQFDAFTQDPQLERENEYFLENIGNVTTAEDLMKDRRLLQTALNAFGLGDEIYKGALIQRVLEDGTTADDNLASRLGDDRWVKFSESFGFGAGETVQTGSPEAMRDLVFTGEVQAFEEAIGEQDQTMRFALYAQREVPLLAEEDFSTNTKIYNILGSPPMREYFETILNLPSSFGQIDLEQQLELMKDRLSQQFGSDDLSEILATQDIEDLTVTYLARAQIRDYEASQSAGSIALTLLAG